MERLLEVTNLHTSFFTYSGEVKAVRGVGFHVDEGEAIAIVGESGCGKCEYSNVLKDGQG